MNDRQTFRLDKRKAWEEPEIVLERSLEVVAQGGGPPGQPQSGGPPSGFLGPLGLSPSSSGVYCI
jgi:hypothetical protein